MITGGLTGTLGLDDISRDQTGRNFRFLVERGISPRLVWLSFFAHSCGFGALLFGLVILAAGDSVDRPFDNRRSWRSAIRNWNRSRRWYRRLLSAGLCSRTALFSMLFSSGILATAFGHPRRRSSAAGGARAPWRRAGRGRSRRSFRRWWLLPGCMHRIGSLEPPRLEVVAQAAGLVFAVPASQRRSWSRLSAHLRDSASIWSQSNRSEVDCDAGRTKKHARFTARRPHSLQKAAHEKNPARRTGRSHR